MLIWFKLIWLPPIMFLWRPIFVPLSELLKPILVPLPALLDKKPPILEVLMVVLFKPILALLIDLLNSILLFYIVTFILAKFDCLILMLELVISLLSNILDGNSLGGDTLCEGNLVGDCEPGIEMFSSYLIYLPFLILASILSFPISFPILKYYLFFLSFFTISELISKNSRFFIQSYWTGLWM